MIPGLDTLIDRLQGLFGRGYLLAGFFPVLILTALCALVAGRLFPSTQGFFARVSEKEASLDQLLSWLGLLLILALAGFIFWSLNTWLRELLEGRYLPSPIRRWLEARQQEARLALEERLDQLRPDLSRYRRVAGMTLVEAIREKDSKAGKRQWANLLAAAETAARERTETRAFEVAPEVVREHKRLLRMRRRQQVIPFRSARRLFEALLAELESAPADGLPELVKMRRQFLRLARYATVKVESEYARLWCEKFWRFPSESAALGPTGLANMAELFRHYTSTRYGMEVDVFWPRLQKIVAGDKDFLPLLGEAKTKLDFAVAMTWTSGLFALGWSIVIPLYSESFLLFPLVITPAIVATALFYLVAFRAYRAFGEVLRSAVDLFRFQLLEALHLKLPPRVEDERALWQELSRQALLTGSENLEFQHPKGGGG